MHLPPSPLDGDAATSLCQTRDRSHYTVKSARLAIPLPPASLPSPRLSLSNHHGACLAWGDPTVGRPFEAGRFLMRPPTIAVLLVGSSSPRTDTGLMPLAMSTWSHDDEMLWFHSDQSSASLVVCIIYQ